MFVGFLLFSDICTTLHLCLIFSLHPSQSLYLRPRDKAQASRNCALGNQAGCSDPEAGSFEGPAPSSQWHALHYIHPDSGREVHWGSCAEGTLQANATARGILDPCAECVRPAHSPSWFRGLWSIYHIDTCSHASRHALT